ncbi:diaminopimelate epimerase [Diaphorobacter ruginosibacter]|uniref:Diaminopimelate epimerase n=1 Tax=Diaphorobacter ruginosibacter TaxID=1715720 RepID=A0A7G9RMA1_9BURK|nr:diaminopimelate epimerase [Diaphorobacter ruginosibacter]QNN56726.1 diaminopimelate epimerase [Diaphorobacter ruginosibacter]
MQIRFTKMQGAGNDFVVLDETAGRRGLTAGQYRFIANRHFGIGADQILTVRAAPTPEVDFEYVIHNADGGEVEQCGNGARCFARFVRDKGLTDKDSIRVQTMKGVIAPQLMPDGRVTVDMGRPEFTPALVPFDAEGLVARVLGDGVQWPVDVRDAASGADTVVWCAVASMGNPHAVQLVEDVATAPVEIIGRQIESHRRFPNRVNAGFMQILGRAEVKLRVFERGVGETLACGTGACAAVATGIRLGLLDRRVDVHTPGGLLTIAWSGDPQDSVFMTGPATTVFEGQIDIPDDL